MKKVFYIFSAFIIMCFTFTSCRSTHNTDFIESINSEVISSNILIIPVEYSYTESSLSVAYSVGFSGVIFRKAEQKYYALTAYHAMKSKTGKNHSKMIVLAYDQPTVSNATLDSNFAGSEAYYSQFPEATVEYYDEKYDLAVISFSSGNDFTVLPISLSPPKYKDTVATMSNPFESERNVVTVGKITSIKPVKFGDKLGQNQYEIIEHTAKIRSGSSGSALLNEDLEIVGINLGGSENLLHWFVRGKAMPSDRILDFIYNMDNSLK